MSGERTVIDYEHLYKSNGFFWNDTLAQFVADYAGKELEYRHPISGQMRLVHFCAIAWIRVGRDYYSRASDVACFLGEEVAPVGDCDNEHVELFLSESGRFIGLTDYQFLEWGESKADWVSSVKTLLLGQRPKIIGTINREA